MAIVESVIESQITQLLESTGAQEQPASAKSFANGLAIIIANAVRNAQVVIPPGGVIVVTTPSGGPATNASPGSGILQ